MSSVSVIMGIYNCSSTLSNSIESMLTQTYTDWELIMCDDCSTDNTFKIANEYAKKHSNILLIKNESNRGLAFSLNQCLKYAKGKYIARMDADDLCLEKRFEKQVNFLNKYPEYHVVGSSVILFDENGDKAIRKTINIPSKYDLARTVPHIHPTVMMRKEVYDRLDGYIVSPRTRRGQDADLWFRFYGMGFKGYNIQQPLLKYHESISDYKKRSFRVRWMGMKTKFLGYKKIELPAIYYFFAFKPLVSALIPKRIMYFYHKKIKGQKL